jgi:hypothetical protein
MTLRAFLIGTLTALAAVSCGGGSNFAGGIGGTGVSYGPVTGFGSVIVNGTEFNTASASFTKDGVSTTQAGLGVGMVVSVTNDGSGNAKSVSFKDNAQGPVSSIVANGFTLLGLDAKVNNLTVYAGGITALADINTGDIVEVSGQITDTNTVLATRVEKLSMTCPLSVGEAIEVKGTVSNINSGADTFDIGTFTMNANGHMPANLTIGDYVEVRSSACPSGNVLTANNVETATEGPDLSDLDHHDQGDLEVKGILTGAAGSAPNCSFMVNGQSVTTDANTAIQGGGNCTTLADGTSVEVQGQLGGGTLLASQINLEDSSDTVSTEYVGFVNVLTSTSNFDGTITVEQPLGTTLGGPFTVSLETTRFEGESQSFDLGTMQTTPTCAEVKVNTATGDVVSIEQKSASDCP